MSSNFSLGDLSVLCVNVRSIRNKFAEFKAHLSEVKRKFSFIFITESWLKADDDVTFEIEGYKSKSIYREGRRGGGIKLYFLEYLSLDVITEQTFVEDFCEMLTVESKVPKYGKIILSCIYRPPNTPFESFLEKMENLLSFVHNSRAIVTGDFNLNISGDSLNSDVINYLELFAQCGFYNEIDIDTYASPSNGEKKSCIDHLWTNFDCPRESFVVHPSIADHYAISIIFRVNFDDSPIPTRFRDYKQENIESYNANIVNEFSSLSFDYSNVDTFASELQASLLRIQNKYFPIKKKILTQKRIMNPWLTNNIIKCIRKKYAWYKKFKQKIITYRSYKAYCSSLRSLLRYAQRNYYISKLRRLNRDPRKNWKILNKLLNRRRKDNTSSSFIIGGREESDCKVIADEFCKFFTEKPKLVLNSIPGTQSDFSHLVGHNPNTMSLFPTNDSEVHKAVMSLQKMGNLEALSSKFLKLSSLFISPFIAKLFNLCVERGVYPGIFKTARVTPIFKNKGSRDHMNNYRPISVMCNMSKIFEKLLNDRLNSFFFSQNLLCQNQFGFRKGRNTEMAAISLVNRIVPVLENKSFAVCIFLDFTSCFDTVDRHLLLKKLQRYGVRGRALDFIRSYFQNRKHFVSYNNFSSEISSQDIGVIQGSMNGPFFYDVYSNDLNFICNGANIMFADDTCLIYSGENLEVLMSNVNLKLKEIYDWCSCNKLSINPSKSEFMLITRKRVEVVPPLYMGREEIKHCNSVKYLGLSIDDDMKYATHGNQLKSKLSMYAGISYRLSQYLDIGSAKKYYYAFVYSSLTYCITVWGGILQSTRFGGCLSRLQDKIVRNLFSKFSNESNLFKEIKLLKVYDIHRMYVSVYMFRMVVLNNCPVLDDAVNLDYPTHSYPTRYRDRAILPVPHIRALRISYHYQFVNIWNSIPTSVKDSRSLSSFKRSLTEFFVSQY